MQNLKRSDLDDSQRAALAFVNNNPKCGLFMEVSMGKTVTALTAISDALHECFGTKAIVIAPKKVSLNEWQQEAQKWEHLRHLNVVVVTGDEKHRREMLNTPADVYVINRDAVVWLIANFSWVWDILVVDESASFRVHNSKRFLALKRKVHLTNMVILLTGTPTPNGHQGLWSQIFLLDMGERLGKNITAFRNAYMNQNPYTKAWDMLSGSNDKIVDKIKDICLFMSVEEKIPVTHTPHYVQLPKHLMEKYQELEQEYVLILSDDTLIDSPHSAALSNKLLQFSGGAIYDEHKKSHYIHSQKIEKLKELVVRYHDENILIAYNYTHEKDMILQALPDAVLMDSDGELAKDWNEGKIKHLVVHPQSTGEGNNLQFGGHRLIYFGMTWDLYYKQQLDGRLPRRGQKNKDGVFIDYILCKNTIDEKIMSALEAKAKTQSDLLEHLRKEYT